MKNFLTILALAFVTVSFSSCDDDDDVRPTAQRIEEPASQGSQQSAQNTVNQQDKVDIIDTKAQLTAPIYVPPAK